MKAYSRISVSPVLTYTVYITSDKKLKTTVKISDGDPVENQADKNKIIVYFEKFSDKSKADKRLNQLSKYSDSKRLSIIRKKNPDLLNLIFTLNDF